MLLPNPLWLKQSWHVMKRCVNLFSEVCSCICFSLIRLHFGHLFWQSSLTVSSSRNLILSLYLKHLVMQCKWTGFEKNNSFPHIFELRNQVLKKCCWPTGCLSFSSALVVSFCLQLFRLQALVESSGWFWMFLRNQCSERDNAIKNKNLSVSAPEF